VRTIPARDQTRMPLGPYHTFFQVIGKGGGLNGGAYQGVGGIEKDQRKGPDSLPDETQPGKIQTRGHRHTYRGKKKENLEGKIRESETSCFTQGGKEERRDPG